MKAADVKADGFYWYLADNEEPNIVYFDIDNNCFWLPGTEISFDAVELPGDFLGPLTPPQKGST